MRLHHTHHTVMWSDSYQIHASHLSLVSPAYCRIVKMTRALATAVVSKISCHQLTQSYFTWLQVIQTTTYYWDAVAATYCGLGCPPLELPWVCLLPSVSFPWYHEFVPRLLERADGHCAVFLFLVSFPGRLCRAFCAIWADSAHE